MGVSRRKNCTSEIKDTSSERRGESHSDTGKRIIKNVLGKTQAEVKDKLKKALEDSPAIDVAHADDYTVGSWLKSWHELYAKPNTRTTTADKYQLFIEEYVTPRIGHIKLAKLTPRDLQKLYKGLTEHGRTRPGKQGKHSLNTTTVHSVHLMLHCACEKAVKERLIPRNHRGLHCPEDTEEGNEDPAPRTFESLPHRGG